MNLIIVIVVTTLIATALIVSILFCVAMIFYKYKRKDQTEHLREDAIHDEEFGECSNVRPLSIKSHPQSRAVGWPVSHRPGSVRPTTAVIVERPPESPAPREFLPGPPLLGNSAPEEHKNSEDEVLSVSSESVVDVPLPYDSLRPNQEDISLHNEANDEEGSVRPVTVVSIRPPEIPSPREFLPQEEEDGNSTDATITNVDDIHTPTELSSDDVGTDNVEDISNLNSNSISRATTMSDTDAPQVLSNSPTDYYVTHGIRRTRKVGPLSRPSPYAVKPRSLRKFPRKVVPLTIPQVTPSQSAETMGGTSHMIKPAVASRPPGRLSRRPHPHVRPRRVAMRHDNGVERNTRKQDKATNSEINEESKTGNYDTEKFMIIL